MATYQEAWIARGVVKGTWTLADGETGAVMKAPTLPDKTVRVFGTFGAGGTVVIERNTGDTLNDPQGNPLTFTAEKTEAILENPETLRPRVSAGTGVTLTVEIIAQSQQR